MTHDPLRASAITTFTTVLIGVVGLALLARVRFDLTGLYPVKAAGGFAVVMFLAIGALRTRHPFARFGPANQITTARAALVALVASLMGEPVMPIVATSAAVVCFAVTLLDGIDGWLARRTRMASAFGAQFDVETDAALIQVLAILVWLEGKAGPWVLASGLLRYAFVGAGRLWPWMQRPLAPSLRGRLICVVQVAALTIAILPAIRPPASTSIAALGLLALGYSFLVDTLWLWRHRPRTQ